METLVNTKLQNMKRRNKRINLLANTKIKVSFDRKIYIIYCKIYVQLKGYW